MASMSRTTERTIFTEACEGQADRQAGGRYFNVMVP